MYLWGWLGSERFFHEILACCIQFVRTMISFYILRERAGRKPDQKYRHHTYDLSLVSFHIFGPHKTTHMEVVTVIPHSFIWKEREHAAKVVIINISAIWKFKQISLCVLQSHIHKELLILIVFMSGRQEDNPLLLILSFIPFSFSSNQIKRS